ncbi:hypothetical protein H0264_04795 [Nocardia huaxiensis]|uniref:DUF2530 domain-containing protein n=1 Tax=Nocardia huaxiensis TaxID=2755382 RepID=A0A7D6VFD5_9NOCA|nr:hypothetical protein [Nocardia huaxiensis]QLY34134.1 hypothetical protein H0264_04795 [Nocardia huaxiensis]UFT00249.1 hypothetical protein LPY97_31625 [Nocardia huaxiensis]
MKVSDTSSSQPPRRSGSPLLYASLALFAVGLLAVVAIFVIGLFTDAKPGVWLYLVAMAGTSIGFLGSIGFALWSGRRAR